MTGLRRRLVNEHGGLLLMGLLLVVALLLVIGLAVDLGRAFIVRRELASIADDAALVGSQQLGIDALRNGRIPLQPDAARAAANDVLNDEPRVRDGARDRQPSSPSPSDAASARPCSASPTSSS